VRLFLTDNDEVSKLRERQGLVDLEGFDLAHETSLEGLFGVSGSGGVLVCGCAASSVDRESVDRESASNLKTSQWTVANQSTDTMCVIGGGGRRRNEGHSDVCVSWMRAA
jgi:hypothetical protein